MKLVVEPSLERFALVKIVAALWTQNDIRALMAKFYIQFDTSNLFFSSASWEYVAGGVVLKMGWQLLEDRVIKNDDWKEIEDKVIEKVPQLPLPELLKEKIECFIRPVGLQILKVMVYDCEGHFFANQSVEFHWTSQGIIDRKKTAEKSIENENLDIAVHFKLACMFCLENAVLKLWNKMSVSVRQSFSYTGVQIYNFWRGKLPGNSCLSEIGSLTSQALFESKAEDGNKAAAEYFFLKLTPSEIEQSLVKTAKKVSNADVLCFLLSLMNAEQQIQVFKNNPYLILQSCLYWPFQSLFIEIAVHMWGFLSIRDYCRLLLNIVSKIKLGYKDFHYRKLFAEFWQKSPSAFKRSLIDQDNFWSLLGSLLQAKEKENFKLIFEDLPFTKKMKLVDLYPMENICECLFFEADWDLLKLIIHKCLQSESEKKNFKNIFERRHSIKSYLRLSENKEKWDQLFPFPDESVCKNTKRKCRADKGKVKRFCHIK